MPSHHVLHTRSLVLLGARWFAVGIATGAVAALLGVHYATANQPEVPIRIGSPVVERSAQDFSVLRIPFQQDEREVGWCHLVVEHERRGWTLRC